MKTINNDIKNSMVHYRVLKHRRDREESLKEGIVIGGVVVCLLLALYCLVLVAYAIN